MAKKLVLLYDSTIEPWDVDIEVVLGRLAALRVEGAEIEVVDIKDASEEALAQWREEVWGVSVSHHQQISQVFGSRRQGGLPYLGKQVPALLVYGEDRKMPEAVYPHGEKRNGKQSDFTIEGFLEQLETRA